MEKQEPEVLRLGLSSPKDDWIRAVWEQGVGKCSNCGSDEHLSARMVVPEEAGGKLLPSNGVLLCRTCEVAKLAVEKAEASGRTPRRPINIWVSKSLYDQVQGALRTRNGFQSMGSLVRTMMGLVAEDPKRFHDLGNYQDRGADVKINLWVDQVDYNRFRETLAEGNLTVTDGIKALLLMYTGDVVPGNN